MSLYIAEHLRTGAITLVFMDQNRTRHCYSRALDKYVEIKMNAVKGWVFKRLEVL